MFGVKESLIHDFVEHPAGTPAPDGRDLADRAWSSVRFDIVLAPAHTAGPGVVSTEGASE